jgi:hypothetical protein
MGGDLHKVFQAELSGKIETAEFQVKKALDLFDVLAYSRRLISSDQLVVIVKFSEEEPELKSVFLHGLATLEEETGKNIFKCFYYEDEDAEAKVKELAETFFNYLFHPEKLEKKEEPKEEFTLPI